jgi:hypothetical protein
MAIFNSYVKLPEDIQQATSKACPGDPFERRGLQLLQQLVVVRAGRGAIKPGSINPG